MGTAEVGVNTSKSHLLLVSSGWLETKDKIDKG